MCLTGLLQTAGAASHFRRVWPVFAVKFPQVLGLHDLPDRGDPGEDRGLIRMAWGAGGFLGPLGVLGVLGR